jgi:HK97 family phage major capsid protein
MNDSTKRAAFARYRHAVAAVRDETLPQDSRDRAGDDMVDARLALDAALIDDGAADEARNAAAARLSGVTGRSAGPTAAEIRDWLDPNTPTRSLHLPLSGIETRAGEWYTSGGVGAGYTVPTSTLDRVIYHINNTSGIFPAAYKLLTATGEAITIPTLTTDAAAAVVTEGSEITADTTLAFGSETLYSRKIAVAFPLSNELLRDSAVDIERVVGDAAGRAIATLLATYLATGAGPGSSLPEGLTVGGTSALTSGSAVSISYDEAYQLAYSLVPGARKGAVWTGGSGVTLHLAQMVNDAGDHVWQPSVALGQPDTLLGHAYYEDAAMPAMTAGLKPLAFWNPEFFWVRLVDGNRNGGIDLAFSSDYEFTKDLTWCRALMHVDSRVIGSGGEVQYITMGS